MPRVDLKRKVNAATARESVKVARHEEAGRASSPVDDVILVKEEEPEVQIIPGPRARKALLPHLQSGSQVHFLYVLLAN